MPTRAVRLDLTKTLVEAVDVRAAATNMSRVMWIERALAWALEQPVTVRTEQVPV